MNIKARLEELNIPDVLAPFGSKITTKEEFESIKPMIKELVQKEEYGYIPNEPESISVEVLETNNRFCAGKSSFTKYRLSAIVNGEELSFVFYSSIPTKVEGKIPAFIHINFRDSLPDQYQPNEEIVDRGYAVFTVCYKDVTSDDGDFNDKCAPVLCKDRNDPHAPGKIAMWSWAARRVLDYVMTIDKIDKDWIGVIGHSRLGKTALLTAAFDERLKFVCVNNSGSSGDALARGKDGEDIEAITNRFPFWFCPKYKEYSKRENELPFDQHFMHALVVPRYILIGTAEEDEWADPKNEFLALTLANPVYALYGEEGLIHGEEVPTAPAKLQEGDRCSFHLRHGLHYLSREDWNAYIDFVDARRK